MTPGDEEQWTLSVQHTEADIDRYVEQFAELLRRARRAGRIAAAAAVASGRWRTQRRVGGARRRRRVARVHPDGAYADNAPIVVDRADGHYVIDVDGRRYLDAISSLWVTTLGHHVPELDDAIRDQLDRGAHTTMLGNGNRVVVELVGGARRASCRSTTRTSSSRPTARARSSRR